MGASVAITKEQVPRAMKESRHKKLLFNLTVEFRAPESLRGSGWGGESCSVI